MARHGVYSLCISIQKLRQLKSKESTVVSHVCSPRWEGFHNKQLKLVRFFDQNTLDHAVFVVKATKKTTQMGEQVIKIEIGNQIR